MNSLHYIRCRRNSHVWNCVTIRTTWQNSIYSSDKVTIVGYRSIEPPITSTYIVKCYGHHVFEQNIYYFNPYSVINWSSNRRMTSKIVLICWKQTTESLRTLATYILFDISLALILAKQNQYSAFITPKCDKIARITKIIPVLLLKWKIVTLLI